MNKKKKSTNTSPYPDEVIDRLARAFYPAILACWNSEEGQREFTAWQAEQAHIANNEKQEVPSAGELPALLIVCGFLRGASGRAHLVFALYNFKTLPHQTSFRFAIFVLPTFFLHPPRYIQSAHLHLLYFQMSRTHTHILAYMLSPYKSNTKWHFARPSP